MDPNNCGGGSASTSSGNTTNFLFGWDLLFKTIENDIKTKSDVLVVLIHFLLIRHGNFRCCGLGEDKTLSDEDANSSSELLPDGWNDNEAKYALRYVRDKKLYTLLAYKSEDSLIINLVDIKSKKITNLVLEPQTDVNKLKGKINEVIPNNELLAQRIKKELIEANSGATSQTTSTSTQASQPQQPQQPRNIPYRDPLRVYDPRSSFGEDHNPLRIWGPRFPEVGRGDLDPFGGIGGIGSGNLLPFPHRPQPHPLNSPESLARRDPNPDHLPPPGGFGPGYFS